MKWGERKGRMTKRDFVFVVVRGKERDRKETKKDCFAEKREEERCFRAERDELEMRGRS